MEEFFNSVGHAFERNQSSVPEFELGIAVLVVLGLIWQIWRVLRRRAQARAAFTQFALERKFELADIEFTRQWALRDEFDPMELSTDLELFDRLSAEEIRRTGPVDLSALLERLRRIRVALHFHELPPSTPLHSTRDLNPSTPVMISGVSGLVVNVDEASLTVEFQSHFPLKERAFIDLVIIHRLDARYTVHCQVKQTSSSGMAPWQYVLTHDEAPVRFQQREYSRLKAEGRRVRLRPFSPAIETDEVVTEVAHFRDLSGGGALIITSKNHPVDERLAASFLLDNQYFSDVLTIVRRSNSDPDGQFALQVEFSGMDMKDRERLVAAVTRSGIAAHAAQKNSHEVSSS